MLFPVYICDIVSNFNYLSTQERKPLMIIPMRVKIILLMLLAMSCCTQLHAQRFLENLGQSIKKEIKKEVQKKVNKGISNFKDNLKGSGQKQQQQQHEQYEQQPRLTQEQPRQVEEQIQTKSKSVANSMAEPITKMQTWPLVVKNGKPYYTAEESVTYNEPYILFDVEYEHPDGVKPFMYTTAVATFKAKEGYCFNRSLKLNESTADAENTTGFKIVDSETVKIYLTAFTGAMGQDVRISPAMRAYKEKISTQHLTPVATAQLHVPLYDYWQSRLHGAVTQSMVNFRDKHMRSYYAYPTTEEVRCTDGSTVKDGEKTTYNSAYKILSVDILDEDLSDDIPGLVGEWCLVSGKRYLPKACLKEIKSGSKYAGMSAKAVNSAFEFAGGSGTIEDPYLIQTAEQLNAMRKGPTYHYKLIADIDLSNWGNWIPIGGSDSYGFMGGGWNKADKGAHSFQGSLDGNGHVISGMQIVINEEIPFPSERSDWRAYGLFASLATNPENYKIKNLGVVNFNIDVQYTSIKNEIRIYAAAICGGMNNGTDIFNCYSKGGEIKIRVKGNEAYKGIDMYGQRPDGTPTAYIYAGGICSSGGGEFGGAGCPRKAYMHIEQCANDSNITVEVEDLHMSIHASGIISHMGTSHIHECYNSGNITLPLGLDNLQGAAHESMAAGICSFAAIADIPGIYHTPPEGSSFIKNCYNSGQIIARNVAGIFGLSLSDIHIEDCYNVGTLIGNEFDLSNGSYTINPILGKTCAVIPYGAEFVRRCYTNGTSVTGTAWKTSTTLGRKVLVAHAEDTHPSKMYEAVPENIGPYTDVKKGVWYGDAVQWAVDQNLPIGTSETTFSPNKNCTRAALYMLMWSAAGSPKMTGANPFTDVKATDAHYDAALWASEMEFVSGTTFAPQTIVTRGELAIALWKNAGRPEVYVNQFLDIENHHTSDLGLSVGWACTTIDLGGTDFHKFSPKKTCTRAQVINYAWRALK